MVRKFARAAVSITLLFWLAASLERVHASKDQSRIGEEEPKPPSPASPFSPYQHNDDVFEPEENNAPADPFEVLDPNDIPQVETIELTMDIAKRAIDALEEVRDKYNDDGIDEYETLEEFVSATSAGKRLEDDVKKFGFSDISDWNTSISSVGFAYSAVLDNEEDEIRQQISEIQIDPQIAPDDKKRMIESLQAMIPSDNNKSVVRKLMDDTYYSAKLKLLEEAE